MGAGPSSPVIPPHRPAESLSSPPDMAVDCDAIPVADDDRAPRDACLAARGVDVASERQSDRYKKPAKNPKLADSCGIDLAVVLDKSASIGRTGMRDLKRAADTFTDALVDTGSQVSVTAFDTDAAVLLDATDLTSGSGIDAIQGSYRRLSPNGFTNWTHGLRAAKGTFDTFDDGLADLTIVITDGNPNTVEPNRPGRYPDGSPRAVNPAIDQANEIKRAGSHMFVVAVGDADLTPITLISGREEFNGRNIATAGYLQTTDYDSLAEDLRAVAVALCGGSVIIHKQTDEGPAAGWKFTALSRHVSPRSQTTGATGATGAFEVSGFTRPTRWITFQEEQRDDYYLGGVECDAEVAEVDEKAGTWDVRVGVHDIVHCTVLNHLEQPHWQVTKSSDPPSGTTVLAGDVIEYTLDLSHLGGPGATDLRIVDDISELAPYAAFGGFVGTAPDGYSWDEAEPGRLVIDVDRLDAGQNLAFTYRVTVDDAVAPGTVLRNHVLTNCPEASDRCATEHRVPNVDLILAKAADPGIDGEPVSSGATPPDTIEYEIGLFNRGTDPAYNIDLTDTLPQGVSFVAGSQQITTWPEDSAANWIVTEIDGGLRLTYADAFNPGDVLTLTFSAQVGRIPQPDRTKPIADLVNRACVAHTPPPGDGRPHARIADERCVTAATPVKSIALAGEALCVNNAPWFDYEVTPANMATLPTVALIWWTPTAFDGRDPSIPAGDTAALLADGASQVDSVTPPAGWSPGQPITGRQLWPGAVIDASGKAVDWPGWTLRPDGTWVLDPNAPFYDLRNEAIVEIRVNPSNDVIAVYPPPTPGCNAAPPGASGAHARPARIATTGFDAATLTLAALVLTLLGALGTGTAVMVRRRRQSS